MGRTALASALNLATELIEKRQDEEREYKRRAVELEQKFRYETKLKEYDLVSQGLATYDPQTGQFRRLSALSNVPPGLEPYEYTDPITGTKYRTPNSGADISADEETKFYDTPGLQPGAPFPGTLPLGRQRRGALQSAINAGVTESPSAVPRDVATAAQFPLSLGAGTGDDPIIRTGTDRDTGRRVGQTRSGRIVPIE